MSRSKRLQEFVRLTLLTASLATAIPVLAEEGNADKSATTLGAVIVTAQKREESIQDVPIAVTAISQSELLARGIDSGKDIL